MATRQHGVVHHRQLLALGFTDAQIRSWVRRGALHVLFRHVYGVGHTDLSHRGRWLAAVMACRSARGMSALSHRASGSLHALLRSVPSGPIDVTTTGRVRPAGIRYHWARHLDAADVTTVAAIPTTTVARTLLDLAETLSPGRLHDALEQALRIGVFDLRELEATIARNPGRHGIKPLRAQLKAIGDTAPFIGSGFELDLRRRLREAGAPEPLTQQLVAGEPVDLYWPDYNLVVETDGDLWHKLPADRARDARRDRKLTLAGQRVLRVTDTEYAADPGRVVADILATLSQRAA